MLRSRRFDLPEDHQDSLKLVYDLPSSELLSLAVSLFPRQLDSLDEFLATLSSDDLAIALRACLLLFKVTKGSKVPRAMQLEAMLAVMGRKDSLVNAGTGSGKTVAMLLAVLLDPVSVSLVISPLIRLQINQVSIFHATLQVIC